MSWEGTLGDFIRHAATLTADLESAKSVAIVRASKMVARESKAMIGKENPEWPPLAESTIEDKRRQGYKVPAPLLREGDLRDSIQWSAPHHEGVGTVCGYVGSNDPVAEYQELGTSRIPPRSFLMTAAVRKAPEVVAMTGRMMYGALAHGGPAYRELTMFWHLARAVGHQAEEAFDDARGEDGKKR